MPYFLILLTFFISSCKVSNKTNNLSESGYSAALVQNSYLTIKDTKAVNYLRGKLLNQFVEEKIPSRDKVHEIYPHDEFHEYKVNPDELNSYIRNEKKATKLIVSYTDRIEVYFIPEYVPLELIISKLGLKAEEERTFRWIKTDVSKTYNGARLYLVSLNIDDIIKNDQSFFEEAYDYNNQYLGQKIKLAPGKMIEIDFAYNILIQNEETSSFTGIGTSCTRDLIEAGMCGPCHYSRNTPAESYSKVTDFPISDMGVAVRMNDNIFNISEMKSKITSGNIKINIDSTDFNFTRSIDIEIISNGITSLKKYTSGHSYSGFCKSTSNGEEINLKRKLDASVKIKVLGRGSAILSNIL